MLDLSAAEIHLSLPVLDVQQGRRELGLGFASSSQDTLARSRDGAADLVGGGSSVTKNTVDGDTHVQSQLGVHDDLHTASLRLHEAVPGGSGWPGHFLRSAAMSKLVLCIASGLHVSEFI